MNTVVEDDDIDEVAARWVLRLDRDALPEAEQLELDAWLDADSRHRGAFIRAQAIWSDLDRVAALSAGRAPRAEPSQQRRFLRAASMAGAILAVAFAALGVSQRYLVGREATELGEIRRLMLDDGSALALNTSSVVQVKFDEHERRVVLRRGEASFRVMRDEQRPFVVEAGDVSVRAIGTAFTVRRRTESDVEVIVTEGVVDVVRAAPEAGEEVESQRLGRNQEVLAEAAQPIEPVALSEGEVARRLAWHDGRLIFDGERLATAVAEVNRYSTTPVVIDDPLLGAKSFVGVFRIGDARGFAHAAAAAFDVRVREQDGTLHLED